MLIVQKFGGTSVADKERIFNCAKRLTAAYKSGAKVVAVVSAQGDATDDLIEKALEVNENPSKREMDMLLTTGEQQSAALLALAVHKLGCPAVSLNGTQAGIITTSVYQNARFKRIETERVEAELEKKNIVIVTGFQGVNRYGDPTTLGRGASDTSAVALAAALGADLCEIYTDVDGIFTADPRITPTARKLTEIGYNEMLELAAMGAKVLQKRSVELAKKYQVKLVVRSSLSNDEGTAVKEDSQVESMFVTGVALDENVARVSVCGVKDEPGVAFKVFSLLAKSRITVDIILQSIGRHGTKDISFTVEKGDLDETMRILEANRSVFNCEFINSEENVAKLSVVGAGMATNPGIAAKMFEALFEAGVNISMISTSEIKISVLIDSKNAEMGTRAVHDKFIGENMRING